MQDIGNLWQRNVPDAISGILRRIAETLPTEEDTENKESIS